MTEIKLRYRSCLNGGNVLYVGPYTQWNYACSPLFQRSEFSVYNTVFVFVTLGKLGEIHGCCPDPLSEVSLVRVNVEKNTVLFGGDRRTRDRMKAVLGAQKVSV